MNGTLIGYSECRWLYGQFCRNNAGVNPIGIGFRGDPSGYGAFDGGLDEFAYYTKRSPPLRF